MSLMKRILLLLALPSGLFGQEPRWERIRQAFPAEAVSRVEAILTAAEAAQVPTEALVAKALEGRAKRVSTERVVAALEAYAGRLEAAASLLDPAAARDAAALVAAADAVMRGVPPDMVSRLAAEHGSELAVPLVVLGDLADLGVPVSHAYAVLEEALRKRRNPEEILAIPLAVRRLIQEGKPASEAAIDVRQTIGLGRFQGLLGPQGMPTMGPPSGPPVPPGAGPPEDVRRPKLKPPDIRGWPPPGG
jgi:hypothetical protein